MRELFTRKIPDENPDGVNSIKSLNNSVLPKNGYIALVVGLVLIILTLFSGFGPANKMSFDLSKDVAKDNYNYYLPRITLPKGDYKFGLDSKDANRKIIIESDGGETVFEGSISDLNNNEVSLSKDYAELALKADGNADLKKLTVTGHGSIFNDKYFLALILFLGLLWLLYVKYGKHKDNLDAFMPVFLVLIGLVSSYTFFINYLTVYHDVAFHIERIEGLKEGLQAGQFPVRIQPRQINGYGYSVGLYYPDLFLYFPAVLRLCGVSLVMAYQSLWIAAGIATSLITYYSVKGITKSRYSAAAAAVIYTTCTWRLTNICIRGAMGEGLAMVFLPLLIYGLYEIVWGEKKWWVLVLGATFILQSHIISTIYCAVFAAIVLLFSARRLARDKRWLALLKAVGMILLVNAWFLVAFVTTYMGFEINDTFDLSQETDFPYNSTVFAQLLNALYNTNSLERPYFSGVGKSLPLTPGIGVLAAAAVGAIFLLFPSGKGHKKAKNSGFMTLLFAIGMTLLFMSTSLFPWKLLTDKLIVFKAFANIIQFPWRFITLPCALLSIVGAWAMGTNRKGGSVNFLALISVVCIMGVLVNGAFVLSHDIYLKKGVCLSKEGDVLVSHDYLPAVLNTGAPFERNNYKTSEKSFEAANYSKNGTNINVELSKAPGKENCWLEVPLIYYWGYKAVDGNGERLDVVQNNEGIMRVMLRPDTDRVSLKYTGTWFYRLGDIITLLTLIALAALAVFKRYMRKNATPMGSVETDVEVD